MSIADKFKAKTAGLGEVLDRMETPLPSPATRTAPGQLMAFRNEMITYEDTIAALEARVKDLQSSSIPVASISPNPGQPRRVFPETEIQKLAESILEMGLIQPIVVRRVKPSDTYQLIFGERRWRAHKLLGKTEIKAAVIEAGDDDLAIMAMVENTSKEGLTDYEIAKAIHCAEIEFPERKHMMQALGIERSDRYRYLAFNDLPVEIKGDLDVNPHLLDRLAASAIQSTIKKYGDDAKSVVSKLWPRVKSGDLDQTKIAATIEAVITRSATPKSDRDITKLYAGKDLTGSITRDAGGLAIKIKTTALTPEKEAELRAFVVKMFA